MRDPRAAWYAVRSCAGRPQGAGQPQGRWLAHPAGPPPEEQFSLGLGFLLDGIARCLTMTENPAC